MGMIDDIIDDVRSVNRIVEPALALIAVVQKAVGVGGATAERAIEVIRAALTSFDDVASGAVTKEQALSSLAQLQASLQANDAEADGDLDARFR